MAAKVDASASISLFSSRSKEGSSTSDKIPVAYSRTASINPHKDTLSSASSNAEAKWPEMSSLNFMKSSQGSSSNAGRGQSNLEEVRGQSSDTPPSNSSAPSASAPPVVRKESVNLQTQLSLLRGLGAPYTRMMVTFDQLFYLLRDYRKDLPMNREKMILLKRQELNGKAGSQNLLADLEKVYTEFLREGDFTLIAEMDRLVDEAFVTLNLQLRLFNDLHESAVLEKREDDISQLRMAKMRLADERFYELWHRISMFSNLMLVTALKPSLEPLLTKCKEMKKQLEKISTNPF